MASNSTVLSPLLSNLSLANRTGESLAESFGPLSQMEAAISEIEHTNESAFANRQNAGQSLLESSQGEPTSQGNVSQAGQNGLALISQRYNQEQFSDRIVGEISNSGSEPADYVEVVASFYDTNGQIVGTASGYTDPDTIQPGDKPFTVLVTGDAIEQDAVTYDLTIQWRNSDFDEMSERVAEGQMISASSNEAGEDEDSE